MTVAVAMTMAVPALDELSIDHGGSLCRSSYVEDASPSKRSLNTTERSVASIPSKYLGAPPVQTLCKDVGFGSSATKGWVASMNDPTPGPYQQTKTLIHRGGSVSCKGSGGFCSGDRRTSDIVPRNAHETPAPSYWPEPQVSLEPSSGFARPCLDKDRIDAVFKIEEGPGPGTYKTNASRQVTAYQAAFASTTARHKYKSFGPAPGAYDLRNSKQIWSFAARDARGRAGSTAWARSNTKRRGPDGQVDHAPHASDPNTGRGTRFVAGLPKHGGVDRAYVQAISVPGSDIVVPPSHVALKFAGINAARTKQPGPAAYDASKGFHATKTDRRNITRKAWAHTLGADRWGRAVQRRLAHAPTPGPGWYDVAASTRRDARTALSAAFVSGTERKFRTSGSEAPGPAFYSPRRAENGPFGVNATGRWV